ncbi:S1 family peptidase [Vibrio owensii]|uniref:S1 family peptidase n=1 Tax=Vibrio harveyi group TaxID=717610 RepID=UPI003CC6ADA2
MKKTIKTTICAALVTTLLSGCAYRINGKVDIAEESKPLDYLAIGVPYLLGGHGTGVPVSEHLSLTASHVAKYSFDDVIAYHPECDIALVARDNAQDEIPARGVIFPEETITNFGWGITFRQVTSTGKYHRDLSLSTDGEIKPTCISSISDAAVQSGMSGGPAYNDKGELVGINIAAADEITLESGEELPYERYSVFVPIKHLEGWLEEEIGKYEEKFKE